MEDQATLAQHPDDAAVDRFAAAMKAKLAAARAKGRGGWDNPEQCSVELLVGLLIGHLKKGNAGTFEDIANFAMMLHQRGADPRVLADAAAQEPVNGGYCMMPNNPRTGTLLHGAWLRLAGHGQPSIEELERIYLALLAAAQERN